METQRIALFGANTKIGERILNEALNRGHKVTAIVTEPGKMVRSHPNLTVLVGNVMNKNDISSKIKGHDVVISAYEVNSNPSEHVTYTDHLIEAVNNDDIHQLIVLGHPGLTETEAGFKLPANAEAWKAVSQAQQKVLDLLEDKTNKHWSYIHSPELSKELGKSGKPEPSDKLLVKNSESEQYIPVKDCPQAVLEEAEHFISEERADL
jgi:putative NADH-flavin reductase